MVNTKKNAKKVTISLAENTLDYIDVKAKEIGTNRSAMLSFMVETYRKQDDAINVMGQLQEQMRDLVEQVDAKK